MEMITSLCALVSPLTQSNIWYRWDTTPCPWTPIWDGTRPTPATGLIGTFNLRSVDTYNTQHLATPAIEYASQLKTTWISYTLYLSCVGSPVFYQGVVSITTPAPTSFKFH